MKLANSNTRLTNEQLKLLAKKIDFEKLFDALLVEYDKKEENKKLQMSLVRKER